MISLIAQRQSLHTSCCVERALSHIATVVAETSIPNLHNSAPFLFSPWVWSVLGGSLMSRGLLRSPTWGEQFGGEQYSGLVFFPFFFTSSSMIASENSGCQCVGDDDCFVFVGTRSVSFVHGWFSLRKSITLLLARHGWSAQAGDKSVIRYGSGGWFGMSSSFDNIRGFTSRSGARHGGCERFRRKSRTSARGGALRH